MIYDVYGDREPNLGMRWAEHESDYLGLYFAARPQTAAGKLRPQWRFRCRSVVE
jgi:hypothetical protein